MAYSTVADLVGLAIQIENTCQALYESMEKKFSHQPEVASYWHRYALEEAGHARWLADLRAKSATDELAKQADADVLTHAQKMLENASVQGNKNIHNFEDAYQIANELENSETNAVFEFLISNYAGDRGTVNFLRTQLEVHMSNLQNNLPQAYQSKSARQSLKAL
jgi:rubrerythrin